MFTLNSQVRHSQIANHPTAIDTSLDLVAVSKPIATILQRALSGKEITEQEGTALFSSSGSDVAAIAQCADIIRQRTVGDSASFVITRNINFTNICYMGCKFCGFSKGKNDADAQLLSMQEIAKRAQQAWDRGATEVCIQGDYTRIYRQNTIGRYCSALKNKCRKCIFMPFLPSKLCLAPKTAT